MRSFLLFLSIAGLSLGGRIPRVEDNWDYIPGNLDGPPPYTRKVKLDLTPTKTGNRGASPSNTRKFKLDLTPRKIATHSDCITTDNHPGRCVTYYQCNTKTHTIVAGSASLLELDIRSSGCSHYLLFCCRLTDVVNKLDDRSTTAESGTDITDSTVHRNIKLTNGNLDANVPVTRKVKIDLTPTKTKIPSECITRDNHPGRCVYYYQCNTTTGTIINDGSSLLDIRSSRCSHYLHVCCRLTNSTDTVNNKETTSISGGDENTVSPVRTTKPTDGNLDAIPPAKKIKLDLTPTKIETPSECVTKDNHPGRCVYYYQCNLTTNAIITDGASLFDIRSSRCSNALQVCCRMASLTDTPNSKDSSITPVSGETNTGRIRKVKLSLTPTKIETPSECITKDNHPGRCVYYYQCNLTTNAIITDGASLFDIRSSRCSNNLQVCCRLTELTDTQNNKDAINVSDTETPVRTPKKLTNGNLNATPPNTRKLKLDLSPTKIESPSECITRDNHPGRCVYYYQCFSKTNTIINDGSTLLDIRSSRCSHYLHVCCRLTELTYSLSKDSSLTPVSGENNTEPEKVELDLTPKKNGDVYATPSNTRKVKLDLTPTKSETPSECTTKDNQPGRCVYYYQCNITTNTIINDGSSLLDIRSSRCSNYLHVCCRLTNLTTLNNKDTSFTHVSGDEDNTAPPVRSTTMRPTKGDPDTTPSNTRKVKLDLTPTKSETPSECITRDNHPGRCVYYYQCNINTNTIINDGSSLLDIRSSRCSHYLHVCCRLTNLMDTLNNKDTSFTPVSGDEDNTAPPVRTTMKPTKDVPDATPSNRRKKLDLTPTKIETPSECITGDNHPGRCVHYYLCNTKTNTIINDGSSLLDIRSSRCSHSLHVCCKLTELTDSLKNKYAGENSTVPLIRSTTRKPVHDINSDSLDRASNHYKDQTNESQGTEEIPQCGYSMASFNDFHHSTEQGSYANYGQFPFMVAIIRKSGSDGIWSQANYLGGGTLIHPSVVMTVAHKLTLKKKKLEPYQLKCRAGEWDTQTDLEIYAHQERDVAKYIIHEDYYRPSLYNDIALLVMATPFDLKGTPHIGIGCLGMELPPNNYDCFSMGWGKDFMEKKKNAVVLKKVPLQIVSHNRCQEMLRRNSRLGQLFNLHDSFTCANGADGIDTSRGDGGSPLVCPVSTNSDKTRYVVYGMVAFSMSYGNPQVPGVYANVPHLRRWVDEKMQQEGLNKQYYTIS